MKIDVDVRDEQQSIIIQASINQDRINNSNNNIAINTDHEYEQKMIDYFLNQLKQSEYIKDKKDISEGDKSNITSVKLSIKATKSKYSIIESMQFEANPFDMIYQIDQILKILKKMSIINKVNQQRQIEKLQGNEL